VPTATPTPSPTPKVSGTILVVNSPKIIGANVPANSQCTYVTAYPIGSTGNVSPLSSSGLFSPAGIARDPRNGNIYVVNQCNTITVYAADAYGNAAPIAVIGGSNTGLYSPTAIALDSVGNIYVANPFQPGTFGPRILEYAAGSSGNVTPTATISGSNTGLDAERTGIALDASGKIYAALDTGVNVYPAGSNGNVAPIASLDISTGASAVAFDSRNLYVAGGGGFLGKAGSVTVYPLGSTGHPAPVAAIGGSNTQLGDPAGIAVDSAHIYVANSYGSGSVTVYPLDANGNVAPVATVIGPDTGLDQPSGIALDSSGAIYVTNYAGDTITMYANLSNGDVAPSAMIGNGGHTGLQDPQSIALDSKGEIYVTNYFGCQPTSNPPGSEMPPCGNIMVYGTGSNAATSPIATISDAGLAIPTGIALDSTGEIYVANYGILFYSAPPNQVSIYAAGSQGMVTPIDTVTAGPYFPTGIAVDSSGKFYVANSGIYGDGNVTVYAPVSDGAGLIATISGPKTGLSTPLGVAVDESGSIYVLDSSAGILVFPPASSGDTPPMATISGSNTQLNGADGIALDSADNIYVTNGGNLTSGGNNSVTVYAAGSSGNVPPIVTISGVNTLLSNPSGIAIGPAVAPTSTSSASPTPAPTETPTPTPIPTPTRPENLFVTNPSDNTVTIYPAGFSGDVTPIATISGPNTGLSSPGPIALDPNGNLYVENAGSVTTVYPPGSSGDVAPMATITGIPSGSFAVDASGNIYGVSQSGGGGNSSGSVIIYAVGSDGKAAPMATISGSNTGLYRPNGIALDLAANIYVSNAGIESCTLVPIFPAGIVCDWISSSVTVYLAGANGNVAPISISPAPCCGSDTTNTSTLAVAVDSSDNEYVIEGANPYSDLGPILESVVGPGFTISGPDSGLNGAVAIAVDSSGDIYVLNSGSGANPGPPFPGPPTIVEYPSGATISPNGIGGIAIGR